MSAFYDEEAQIEALRRWWSRNWKPVFAGLLIALVGIAGWQFWSRHESSRRLQASQLYEKLRDAMNGNGNGNVKAMASRLTNSYGDTPYASMAELKLAQTEAANGRFTEAEKRLRWVAGHGEDAGVRAIARLRLAAVLWQLNESEQALQRLQQPQPPPQFRGLYDALRGDILASQHKDAKASEAYQQALLVLPPNSPMHKSVQDKLASLATTQSGAATDASSKTDSGANTHVDSKAGHS